MGIPKEVETTIQTANEEEVGYLPMSERESPPEIELAMPLMIVKEKNIVFIAKFH